MSEKTTEVVDGVTIDVVRSGAGKTLLFLHSVDGVNPELPWFRELSQSFEIVAPWHPGFGHSELPREFRTIGDLAYFYLEAFRELGIEDAVLVGSSFGGWLAAEIAVTCSHRLDRLVLVDALGIKVSDRETPDILDVFNTLPREVHRRSWHDPVKWAPDFDGMTDDELVVHHRSWESLCLYGWHPYMYNPKLRGWLGRISVPTLVLWGESDGLVPPAYGRAYAAEIPGARFATIPGAGHHPHVEQPEAFVDRVIGFAQE
jgi:pimeloyl-ACP methyl ester carboxylesterase